MVFGSIINYVYSYIHSKPKSVFEEKDNYDSVVKELISKRQISKASKIIKVNKTKKDIKASKIIKVNKTKKPSKTYFKKQRPIIFQPNQFKK